MSFCQSGEKATVNYSFAGVAKSYETDQTPIDISVTQLLPNGQCQGLPYRVVFYYTHNFNSGGRYGSSGYNGGSPFTSNPVWGAISAISLGIVPKQTFRLNVTCYGSASASNLTGSCWKRVPITSSPTVFAPHNVLTSNTQYITGIEIIDIIPDTQTAQGFNLCVPFDYTQNCGSLVKLEIKNNGILLLSDQGRSPCLYDVVCASLAEECPPGTCECVCSSDGLVCCYDSRGIAIKSFYR